MTYFVRQYICIVLMIVIGNFRSYCFNSVEIRTVLTDLANKGQLIPIQNDTFKLEKNGYLGEGNYCVVWKGFLTKKKMQVAMKFGQNPELFAREFYLILELNSYFNEPEEEKRFPTIQRFGFILNKYAVLAMNLFDKTVEQVFKKDGLSPANLLRVFYHAVAALEHIQGHDVVHQDIEPNNLMFNIARDKVVLIDYNMAMIQQYGNLRKENRIYCSAARHVKKLESFMEDMKALFHVMLHFADVNLPWQNKIMNKTDTELATAKNQYDSIFLLCKKTGPPAVQKVFEQYFKDVMVKAKDISKIDTDSRRPNTHKMKTYILDGIEALVSNRNPNFYWGPDEKTNRKDKVSGSRPVKQQGNQAIPILPFIAPPIENNKISVIETMNTCTFDTIFQAWAALYKDNKDIARRIDRSYNSFDQFVKDAMATNKMYKTIENRGKLLKEMLPLKAKEKTGTNITTLNLMPIIIQETFSTIASHSDIAYSATAYVICPKCDTMKDSPIIFVPLEHEIDWRYVVDNLQLCIDKMNWSHICEKCKSKIKVEMIYNPVVFIAIVNHYKVKAIEMYRMERNRIPNKIKLNDKDYKFIGVVEQSGTVDSGHVITHLLRSNGEWETYDDVLLTTINETPSELTSLVFIYALPEAKP